MLGCLIFMLLCIARPIKVVELQWSLHRLVPFGPTVGASNTACKLESFAESRYMRFHKRLV